MGGSSGSGGGGGAEGGEVGTRFGAGVGGFGAVVEAEGAAAGS